ncbi:MAG: DNA polymerase II large subunit, partial [Nanoarchaeota archaeon]|nr:DNA polymerase II large subunit [Nanoarchaeota archaeon]
MASSIKGESEKMSAYFAHIDSMIKKAYDIAEAAKKQSFDPMDKVEVPSVSNMAERVEGLISVVAPNIIGSGISERIKELEEKYSALDWRISLIIAEEIAEEKFCKFKDKLEAMDIGIRVGFAYHTMGSVASPIEGFVEFKLGKTNDGKEYFDLYYAGPIRSAGGTGASVSVLIADYVRMKMGYAPYDPTEQEIKRASTELYDYHDRITNLQYLPSEEEIEFMVKNLPVQINGDGSEKIEVSNHKDLPRVATNKIRNGVCLVIGEGLCQKAPKLWKQLSKWGKEFGLDHWNFIGDFVKLQKKIKAGKSSGGDEKTSEKEEKKSKLKIQPDYTFIKDLVAGRPVITHPLREGGFRLRYGRSRTSGYSAASLHPATMAVLDNFVATGTQLKLERPGKAASMTCCDYMEGPVVKLKDGSVVKLDDENEAQALRPQIEEIIFLGDILLCYGDFINRAHKLVPPGYCEEWWVQEFEKAIIDNLGSLDILKLSEMIGIAKEDIESILSNPIKRKPSVTGARIISEKLKIPLHPEYIYYWSTLEMASFINMVKWLKQAKKSCENDKIIKIILPNDENKRTLELLGVPHILVSNEFVVIEKDQAAAFALNIDLDNLDKYLAACEDKNIFNVLDIIQKESKLVIEDKAGVFIGARMGRPEKAKMRKLQGTPHTLFPIGEEGGRLRSFQAALEAKSVNSDFPIYRCKTCDRDTIYRRCEICGELTQSMYYCRECNKVLDKPCDKPSQIYEGEKHKSTIYKRQKIDIKTLFNQSLKNINMRLYPDLIKGVRGTSNKEHIPENLVKGILRAKHDVFVNKDGTTR